MLSRIIGMGQQCPKTESHTKRMEHLPYNPPVFPSQDLSSGVTVLPPKHRQTRKDHHSRAERYQLESHLLTAQIEALQSHIAAYIANQPPTDLRYTPNPLAVVAARRFKERQEVKPSGVLAKEVRKLRMKREELLAAREQMKTEYEERQRSRRVRHPSLGPF